jgi:hypothetical protein
VSYRAQLVQIFVLLVLAGSLGVQQAQAADTLNVYFTQTGGIRVTLADGSTVGTPNPPGTLIPAGTYQLTIYNEFRDDDGFTHQFRLSGPGVNLVTDMNQGEEELASWSYTFQPNSTYVWEDQHRPDDLRGVFRTSATAPSGSGSSSGGSSSGVTSGNSSSGTSSGSAGSNTDVVGSKAVAFRGTLSGNVKRLGKLILTFKGKKVSSLKSGRYRVSVLDETSKSGFTLQKRGKQSLRVTSLPFLGRHAVTLTLSAGKWMFYSRPNKKSYFIVVR